MTPQDDAYHRRLVEEELRAAGIEEPPISMEMVAEHLGVPIREFTLPVWFTGALIYEDGLPAILLNTNRPAMIRRVALGHMLGHILLVLNDPQARYPKGTVDPHAAADSIAAEFVTPAFLVRDQAQKWFNDYRYLAGLFAVDEDRMFEAMKALGLVKSMGTRWEY